MNQDKMKGKWNMLKGELKRKWGQLTDDDLKETEGDLDKLIGKIQIKTGEKKEAVQEWLREQGL